MTASTPTKPMTPPSEHIVFLDLETTGLDHESDHILEVGVVITDSLLTVRQQWSSVVKVSEEQLSSMGPFVREMHTKSCLLSEIEQGNGSALGNIDAFVSDLITVYLPKNEDGSLGKITLAGNSVHFDLSFLKKHMPKMAALFSHRLLDVSVLRELAGRFAPELRYDVGTGAEHRALADALSSVKQLEHYITNMVRVTSLSSILHQRRSFWEQCCAAYQSTAPNSEAVAREAARRADDRVAEWDKRFRTASGH